MLRVFSGKAPTAADVEAELGKLELDRQAVRARLQGIESALADAYGTDTDTSALEADYVALEAKLKALALVERRLQGEKVEAAKRAGMSAGQIFTDNPAVEAGITDWLAGGGAQDWIAQEQRRMHGKANGKPPAPERPLAEVAPARHAAARTVALVEPVDEPFSRGGG